MDKKDDVLNDIAERSGLPKATVNKVLNSLGDSVLANIQSEQKYNLGSLGKLVLRESSARKGRNPSTGEEMDIPAKKSIALRPSKMVKDALN
ncbi:MAG: HU family DNA-binding protein [Halomonas sp.]|nr:HU family DNA-binding protein [Halomonas sp.]MDP3534191.1 HU family DNA-binding protein [Halomonas sp.]